MTTPANTQNNTANNTYEALLVLKPIVDVDNSDIVLKGIEGLIENLKGKITRVDKLGRKRLGYEIGKFKDGFVASVFIELSPTAVVNFRRACKLNEDILRLTLVRRCPKQMAQEALRPVNPRGEFQRNDNFRGDRPGGDFNRGGGGERRFPPRPYQDQQQQQHSPQPRFDQSQQRPVSNQN